MDLVRYLDRTCMMLYMGFGLMTGLYFFCSNSERRESFTKKQLVFVTAVTAYALATAYVLGMVPVAWEVPLIGVFCFLLSVYLIVHIRQSFKLSRTILALGMVASIAAWCASSALIDALYFTLTPNMYRWGCYLFSLVLLILFWRMVWRRVLQKIYDTYNATDWLFIGVLFLVMGAMWPLLRYVQEELITAGNLRSYALLKLAEVIIDLAIIAIVLTNLRNMEKNAAYLVNQQLLMQQESQFRHFKACVEYIDTKAHDLRHQIRSLKKGTAEQAEYLDALEDAVSFYSAFKRTGNEVLDIILTEKSILCKANDIPFVGLVEYSILDFMEQADIYSLFGNAIDNAVEYLKTVEPENRYINLQMRRVNDFLQIRFENYFVGELRFENDLPVTTKKDRVYHGFGVRSISAIAKKYQGSAEIFTMADCFVGNLGLPMEERTGAQRRTLCPGCNVEDKNDRLAQNCGTERFLPVIFKITEPKRFEILRRNV